MTRPCPVTETWTAPGGTVYRYSGCPLPEGHDGCHWAAVIEVVGGEEA